MSERLVDQVNKEMVFLGPIEVVCHPAIRKLCFRPYHNHRWGCPNYGKRADCPPAAPFFLEAFKGKVYIVVAVFHFDQYLNLKRKQHPEWTERALRNPRHWQGHLKSKLLKFLSEILLNGNGYGDTIIFYPEAMGVNVTRTCQHAGLNLEWPPQKIVCQVALIGQKK